MHRVSVTLSSEGDTYAPPDMNPQFFALCPDETTFQLWLSISMAITFYHFRLLSFIMDSLIDQYDTSKIKVSQLYMSIISLRHQKAFFWDGKDMPSTRNLTNATFLLSKPRLPFSFLPNNPCLNNFILRISWPFNIIELTKTDLKRESRSCLQ